MKQEGGHHNRIHIAYLIDTISCNTSGTEKQLLEVIKRMNKNEFSPHLICLRGSDWLNQQTMPCPLFILDYEGFLKWNILEVVKKLRRLIAEKEIQIIQTFFEDSIFITWLSTKFNKRRLVLLSSRRDMGLDRQNMIWYHKLFAIMRPFVNKDYDGIVANSQRIKEFVIKREKAIPERIEVVYNGVDIPEKSPSMPCILRQYSADIRIAIVASLVPVKRHDLLIKAIALLCRKIDKHKIQVIVLGTGQERANIIQLAKQLNVHDVFVFFGAVENVSDYLQFTDIGVLCSDREGLSNAILEYMASGLPVVTTAVGGSVELVSEDNGMCVPAGDPVALADALHKLIVDKHKREQMGSVSRKKAIELFSWQESLYHLEAYYKRMIEEKGVASD